MEKLKHKILKEGKAIGTQIIKVDGFVNHQIDVKFMEELGEALAQRFAGEKVDKILTVESSGIAIACLTAPHFGYPPVVFAKKSVPNTLSEEFYHSEAKSFTKGTTSHIVVSRSFLSPGDRVLILDDFLAHGQASLALVRIIEQAQAHVAGVGIAIEKAFQGGRRKLEQEGLKVESLAIIDKIQDGKVFFG